MGKYIEQHLSKNETIVAKADLNFLFLLGTWLKGLFFFLLLFLIGNWLKGSLLLWFFLPILILLIVPMIQAIVATIRFCATELAVISKHVVGKIGLFNSQSLDVPLDKIQDVKVKRSLWGKIFD